MDIQGVKDRGVLPRYVRMWVLENFGEKGIQRVTNRLNLASRAMFSRPIPHQWYPTELVKEVYETVADEFNTEFPATANSLGAFIAERSVKGFLKYLVRLVSMNKVLDRLGAIWKRYHNGGQALSEITSGQGTRKQGILRIAGYDAGPVWCALMNSYIKTFAESTGATNVKVEKADCIHKGNEVCSWLISWEE